MTSSNESESITFATPITQNPCEHDYVLVRTDMVYFTYQCCYCQKTIQESKLRAMNC